MSEKTGKNRAYNNILRLLLRGTLGVPGWYGRRVMDQRVFPGGNTSNLKRDAWSQLRKE